MSSNNGNGASVGTLLGEYRAHLDVLDDLNTRAAAERKEIDRLEEVIQEKLESAGLEKASGSGIAVTVKEKFRTVYDPEKWDSILRDMVNRGYGYIFHRRLTDAKVMELIDNSVELPDGLSVQPVKELSYRRE